ncbi:hypothetical protein EBN03_18260 [Nocardia stercoris]|uniref:MarR family transcriptional regulator n=1 Tax=Nocardia stercoris TaxID=2483361 RepID=A0A3M2L0Z6_9NOCA|nr:hypothetical protein EBN03_18260 [Nocardia stercoris]
MLAFAERTMSEVLTAYLAERGVSPQLWYAVKLLGQRETATARTALTRDLEGSPGMDAESVRALLARLEREGIIDGDNEIELTETGRTLLLDLREYVADSPTAQLLLGLDAEDLDTTVRTLRVVVDEASKLLAAGM